MRCPHCGGDNPDLADRCIGCDAPLRAAARRHVAAGVLTPLPGIGLDGDATYLPNGAASPSWLTPGQIFAGRYRIIQLLGSGGMGSVYHAWDSGLGIAVAIKIIRADACADPALLAELDGRFKRELLLARQVTHKNVVRIHDLGEAEGIKYITMPYVQGTDLATLLAGRGRLPVRTALRIVRDVVAGLEAAHEAGIVHRDLKPANIMVEGDHAVIMDFGLARSISGGMTVAGVVVGTLSYMAPEQALARPVDQRTDIYAVGLILAEMLVGRRVAADVSAIAELMQRIHEAPPSLRETHPEIPEALDRIVARCIEPEPAARYQTTKELAEDLAILDDDGRPLRGSIATVAARLSSRRSIGGSAMRRRRLFRRRWAIVAAAATVVVAAVGGFLLRDRLFGTPPVTPANPAALAIMPFRNASGAGADDWLGPSVADMLRSELGQSSYLRTISTERIHQILRDLRVGPGSAVDGPTLRRLADFTDADRVLVGQHVRIGDSIRIEATLQNVREQRSVPIAVEAINEAALLPAIAQLAQKVRDNLSLPAAAVKELQARASKPPSQSLAALRHYSNALELTRQGKNSDALKSLQAAVGIDPSFALAYSKLGQTYSALGYDSDAQKASRRALELAGSMPPQDRYLVEANHARIVHDNKQAIAAYENLLKASPDNVQVRLDLARLYEDTGALDAARGHYAQVVARDPSDVDALLAIGRVEIRRQNPSEAVDPLNRALTLAIRRENDEAKGNILNAIGIAYKRLNKFEDALRYNNESLAIRRRRGDRRGMAASLNEIGQIQLRLGNPQEAARSYTDALTLRREIGDKVGTASLLTNLGVLYVDIGRYDAALKLYQESLQIQREVGNTANEALCLNNIGNVYLQKAQYDDALSYFERALQLREKARLPGDVAQTLYNMGDASSRIGQYDAALKHYLRALELWRELGDRRSAATASSGLGIVLSAQGRYGAALEAQQEALKTLREAEDRSAALAQIQTAYAVALSQVGRFDEAAKNLDEALALARPFRNGAAEAAILDAQGTNLLYRGDLAAARNRFEQALQAIGAVPDRALAIAIRVNLARAARQQDPRGTVSALDGLRREAEGLGLRYVAADCTLEIGETALAARNIARARDELERAITQAERLGARPLLARAHHLLATALRRSRSEPEAARHADNARRLLDEIRSEARSPALLKRPDLAQIASAR
jgi:tetratricopeptide (TPR) repeat protein